ncbi:MAG: RDD family protein [Betaproteobacteria bacterium]|jgi:uncharacterized RDD family membrane protein YckC|nr:RDD family protein [Betaproteobacteria bacterium]NBP44883.1 RDD family protein [Betaproteobacteria bacterium]
MSSSPAPELAPLSDTVSHLTPSLKRRMACWLYEGVLLFGVVFLSGYLFSTLSQTRNAMHHRLGMQAFIFLVLAIYFTWFWYKGQTLAMKTWHIRVRSHDGLPLTQTQAFIRYLCSWVWFVPPLLMANLMGLGTSGTALSTLAWVLIWMLASRFHPDRQFWHDAWSRTRLEFVPPPPKV